MSPGHGYEERFIGALVALAPDGDATSAGEPRKRAALATLRRGLGKDAGEVVEMYQYVMPHLPPNAKPWEEDAYLRVAALFAMHPQHWPARQDGRPTNLGASFRRLAQAEGASESVEKRFVALLDAPVEALDQHLRQAVSLLRSEDVPINYVQLLRDIQHWGFDERPAQRAWARAYWAGKSQDVEQHGDEAVDSAAQAAEEDTNR